MRAETLTPAAAVESRCQRRADTTPPQEPRPQITTIQSEAFSRNIVKFFSDIINHSVVRFSDKIDGRVKTLLLSQKC